MRILKLCTFPEGGATIAARRQKEALRESGHDCDLAFIREDPHAHEVEMTKSESEIAIKVPVIAWSYNGRVTTAYCAGNRSEISNTWLSFWQVESFLDEALLDLCLRYDIVHLHWIAGMVSSRLLEELHAHSKEVFITGHDMNHFTGGCHYSAGCERFTTGCAACPQLLADPLELVAGSYQAKMAAMGAIPSSNWVFPSIWLADEFRRSLLCDRDSSPNLLYNCIDGTKFTYLPLDVRRSVRRGLGFADNEIVLVAGAADNTEKRKGFSHIEHAVQDLRNDLERKRDQRASCVIVTFGRGRPWIKVHSPYLRHRHLGSLNEANVIQLFQAADLLLFPSIEENFSNTILESIMCGCPVLAFGIGGVTDIVSHRVNGFVVDEVNEQGFSSALCLLVDLELMASLRRSTEQWRDHHASRYGYEEFAKLLMSLYARSGGERESSRRVPPPKEPQRIYTAIFGEVPGYDIRDHRLFAANLARTVRPPRPEVASAQKRMELDAIYLGFGLEENPEFGRISWMKKKSFVFFRARTTDTPALCIRLSNIGWIKATAIKALTHLRAEYNGTAASVRWLEADHMKAAFVWILPEPDSLMFDSYNTLSLSFSESSIPESSDARGLCLLHNAVTLFELSGLDIQAQHELLTSCEAANQIQIATSQSHYIHPEWPSAQNDHAVVANTLEAWIGVMRAFDVSMRSGA